MQERARCLGGELSLQAREPSGARLQAHLPWTHSTAQGDSSNDN
jgi:nitrate/nitrite-specific signal transduction histidine kinase